MCEVLTMNNLEINHSAIVIEINCNFEVKRRLQDMGLINGTLVKSILKSPSTSIKAYEIRGSLIAIRDSDTKYIKIKRKD